jgi:hypothetical protein
MIRFGSTEIKSTREIPGSMAWWPAHAHGLLPERAADFVIDALSNGRRLKCLAIVDDLSRKAVEIVVEPGIRAGMPRGYWAVQLACAAIPRRCEQTSTAMALEQAKAALARTLPNL